jgi:tripartite-type tricarboxylate transporter receptor subunit TctC
MVNIGSAGIGTLRHLSIEMLKREAGVDVACRGTSAALTDLLGGQIDALFGDSR